jgi:hypothetical protein
VSKSDDEHSAKKEKKSKSPAMGAPVSDEEGPKKEKTPKERVRRKKWFSIHHLKVDKRRPC